MGGGHNIVLTEMDMGNMFWEIPTNKVFEALEWAISHAKEGRASLYFSLCKGGLKHLDWLGASSSKDFDVLNLQEVLDYVTFNIQNCTLLTLGPLILQQGRKRVPIGGYLSAQLAEIWAMWREDSTLGSKGLRALATRVNEDLRVASIHGPNLQGWALANLPPRYS